jgi:hypothetical protein
MYADPFISSFSALGSTDLNQPHSVALRSMLSVGLFGVPICHRCWKTEPYENTLPPFSFLFVLAAEETPATSLSSIASFDLVV